MTEDDAPEDGQDGDGVPDSDPRHIDPAGDMADLVESGEFDIALAEDQSREELREFVERAEGRRVRPPGRPRIRSDGPYCAGDPRRRCRPIL